MKRFLDEDVLKQFLDALEKKEGRKVLFIDMDGVVADFEKKAEQLAIIAGITKDDFIDRKFYRNKGFYIDLEVLPGAKEAVFELRNYFEIRFLSACSWSNVFSFTEKRIWIEKHFGEWSEKRMDLTNKKDLSMGHFLIDDRTKYGAEHFIGEHIQFGIDEFPNWEVVTKYLISKK